MAFLDVHFRAESIAKQSCMYVLLPDKVSKPLPVLYLLHGMTDDHTIWLRRTRIEQYLSDLDLIVVMPDGHRSFYVNDPRPTGCAYEDHIIKDVVGFCDAVLPTIAARRGRAVAGLSMGGYGSMMLSLKNPEMFCAACSHSGALSFSHDGMESHPELDEFTSLLDDRYDCYKLASGLKRSRKKEFPALRIDCGVDDFLIEHNRSFHAHLEKLKVPHAYEEYPGEHNWDYWDEHVRQTLKFVMKHAAKK